MDLISIDDSIHSIISKHSEVKKIMVELGFKDIVMPGMLGSVGRIMTLRKGSSIKHIPIERIKMVFKEHNFEVK